MAASNMKRQEEMIRLHMDACVSLLTLYENITRAYLSDFFVKNISSEIAPAWWEFLIKLEPKELSSLLGQWQSSLKVWPLSLLSYRAACQSIALRRDQSGVSSGTLKDFCKGVNLERRKEEVKNGQYLSLDHCYRRHVKPKKQHEISALAKVIESMARSADIQHVIDVGAGQGHLSRLLSFGYGLEVTTVEASSVHTPKAYKFDSEIKEDMKRQRARNQNECTRVLNQEPQHINATILPTDNSEDFLRKVRQHHRHTNIPVSRDECKEPGDQSDLKPSNHSTDSSKDSDPDFLLTGLHACGDLTSTMLKVFVQRSEFKCLVSVGCCYHKISPEDTGYPLSKYLKNFGRKAELSWEAKEMACHSVDIYNQRLLGNDSRLKSHIYRAALQEIIVDKDPGINHGSIKLTQRKPHELSFEKYAEKALSRLGLDSSISTSQLNHAERRLDHWIEPVAFYTLRLCLAPVIETLLLLDRSLYLHENGIDNCLLPIFDPKLSPRNFALLAAKARK